MAALLRSPTIPSMGQVDLLVGAVNPGQFADQLRADRRPGRLVEEPARPAQQVLMMPSSKALRHSSHRAVLARMPARLRRHVCAMDGQRQRLVGILVEASRTAASGLRWWSGVAGPGSGRYQRRETGQHQPAAADTAAAAWRQRASGTGLGCGGSALAASLGQNSQIIVEQRSLLRFVSAASTPAKAADEQRQQSAEALSASGL